MEKSPLQVPTKAYGTENAYPPVQHEEVSQAPSYEEEVGGYSDASYYQGWEGSGSAGDRRIDSWDNEEYADFEADFDSWDSEEETVQGSELRQGGKVGREPGPKSVFRGKAEGH
ncbi:MAG: hypothetical protein K8R69_02290 [Deltaproteobacteria bacterium]|nr:hypothetical protein [Deltaproteobacteria bacterium]